VDVSTSEFCLNTCLFKILLTNPPNIFYAFISSAAKPQIECSDWSCLCLMAPSKGVTCANTTGRKGCRDCKTKTKSSPFHAPVLIHFPRRLALEQLRGRFHSALRRHFQCSPCYSHDHLPPWAVPSRFAKALVESRSQQQTSQGLTLLGAVVR